MSESGSGSSAGPASDSWKVEAIEEVTDLLRGKLEREARQASGVKGRVLDEARKHVDDLEAALKRWV